MPPSGNTEQSLRVVWKYAIELGDPEEVTEFQIPEGARFLHCAGQGNAICIWFEVPVNSVAAVRRAFRVFGTGDPTINPELSYVGTGIFADGSYVFHVYEVPGQLRRRASACPDHKPVQHRDGKEPWCKACGTNAAGTFPSSRFGAGTEISR